MIRNMPSIKDVKRSILLIFNILDPEQRLLIQYCGYKYVLDGRVNYCKLAMYSTCFHQIRKES